MNKYKKAVLVAAEDDRELVLEAKKNLGIKSRLNDLKDDDAEKIAHVMELDVVFEGKKVHFRVKGKFGDYTACNKSIKTAKIIRVTEIKDEVTCGRCKDIMGRHADWL